jgi:hypothetical protein
MNPLIKRLVRVGFIFLGLFFWGFASFLLSFTQFRGGIDGDQTFIVINNYWIEIVFLFMSGIAALSFAAVYKKTKEIKKRGTALIILATSTLAFLLFLTLVIPMVAFHYPIWEVGTFGMLAIFYVIVVGLYIFAIFEITRYNPWNKLKPKNLRHRKNDNLSK